MIEQQINKMLTHAMSNGMNEQMARLITAKSMAEALELMKVEKGAIAAIVKIIMERPINSL